VGGGETPLLFPFLSYFLVRPWGRFTVREVE